MAGKFELFFIIVTILEIVKLNQILFVLKRRYVTWFNAIVAAEVSQRFFGDVNSPALNIKYKDI